MAYGDLQVGDVVRVPGGDEGTVVETDRNPMTHVAMAKVKWNGQWQWFEAVELMLLRRVRTRSAFE